MKINKVLIANRGEIALRIMRSLRKMDIHSMALYTEAESRDWHVQMADEAYSLGNGTLEETWLNIPLIISLAQQHGADAIHPGYGFLSENASFAKACEQAGIVFIGPQSHVIEKMGSKIMAAQYALRADIPLLPRKEGSVKQLITTGHELGFPLLVKAAAGGGGKGMIRVETPAELEEAVKSAAQQAQRYFADDKVYLEKYITSPRHIEVQILADHHGNVIHLLERECTLQRNHQKVVEEAPSASLKAANRREIHDAAVRLAREVGYRSAGTIEFILDEEGQFYFLEMNTRIQVEHPVTELITGVDIVNEQLKIAMGKTLDIAQTDIKPQGHAIEVRLYAEDPAQQFRPSAGFIHALQIPEFAGVRSDSALNGSGRVHASFDAMISKIIAHGKDRRQATLRMQQTLDQVLVHGIKTNLDLLRNILYDKDFRNNNLSTQSIAQNLDRWSMAPVSKSLFPLVGGLFLWLERYYNNGKQMPWRMAAHDVVHVNMQELTVFHHPYGNNGIELSMGDHQHKIENIFISGNKIRFLYNKSEQTLVFNYSQRNAMFLVGGVHYHVVLPDAVPLPRTDALGNKRRTSELKASLFGRVLKVHVAPRQKVKSGDPLMVLESMKMENAIVAPEDTIISKINVKEGDQVSDGQILISFDA